MKRSEASWAAAAGVDGAGITHLRHWRGKECRVNASVGGPTGRMDTGLWYHLLAGQSPISQCPLR